MNWRRSKISCIFIAVQIWKRLNCLLIILVHVLLQFLFNSRFSQLRRCLHSYQLHLQWQISSSLMLRQCLWLLLSRRTCLPQTMLVYRDEQPPWAVITNISCSLLDAVQTTSSNLLISQLLLPLDDELFIFNPLVCSNHRLPIKVGYIHWEVTCFFFFEDSTMALYLLSFCLLGTILGRIWTRG